MFKRYKWLHFIAIINSTYWRINDGENDDDDEDLNEEKLF